MMINLHIIVSVVAEEILIQNLAAKLLS